MKICENAKVLSAIKIITLIVIFSSFVLNYLSVPLWDYDFWWHIATGRYIVDTGTIPEQDPFSYTSILEENKNPYPEWEKFILKQYWLSQVIFYLIYDKTGAAGIIILRTIILIMTLMMVFWTLLRKSVSFPLAFIFIYTIFMISIQNTGERPVLFTIFFAVLTFFILDDFRDRKSKKIFFLVPLMVLWSNLHGGFVIGIIIIFAFMFGEGISILLKKSHYAKHEIYMFYCSALLAISASFINPLGWDALIIAANIPFKYQTIHEGIQEYFSPYSLYKEQLYPLSYGYVFLVVLSLIILLARFRRLGFTQVILLTMLLVMSLSARRLVIYFSMVGPLILAKETDLLLSGLARKKLPEPAYKKTIALLTVAALISASFYLSGKIYIFQKTKFGVISNNSVPVEAVNFIQKNKLPGRMFNDFGFGGYLAWRLYPDQKTFIDTRSLNINVRKEYGWIMNAEEVDIKDHRNLVTRKSLSELLLAHYNINYVLLTVITAFDQAYPIIYKLVESDQWTLVYLDNLSVLFVKNNKNNKDIIEKYKMPNEEAYNTMIYQTARKALSNKVNPRSLISLGDTFYEMGRLEEALKSYKYAFERMPDAAIIEERIKQLESELETNHNNSKGKKEVFSK